jgi:myo-inositol-hexaphosphate 3-phosphohydrolase
MLNGITYGDIVGIKNKFTNNIIPGDLKLNIYPNPFNNSAKIYFSLPKASNIELKVYNILGEKLHEITRGKYNAGDHQISFNSSGFGSGIYILLLSTDSQILSKKMIILK